MKKITLTIGLVAAIMSAKAQDTTCTYFIGKRVIEFDYNTSQILHEIEQSSRFYDIEVKYGDVLCLDLSDKRKRVRKVITTFFDGTTIKNVLNSNDEVYFTPRGVVKVSVGRSRIKL